MRVISGSRRGAKLVEFDTDGIRPTTDRVKESIFNLIQEYVPSSRVLDLFAGSGALGIEAVSRGASSAVFVDKSRLSIDVIKKNLSNLRFGDAVEVFNLSYDDFFKLNNGSFDLIFLDPPYNKGFIEPVLADITRNNRLSSNGIIVLESDDTDMHSDFERLTVVKQKKYGRSYITVYRRSDVR